LDTHHWCDSRLDMRFPVIRVEHTARVPSVPVTADLVLTLPQSESGIDWRRLARPDFSSVPGVQIPRKPAAAVR
jgi:hypothetical protein